MKILPVMVLIHLGVCLPALATEAGKTMDTMDKINYSVGHQIGGDFKDQGVEMRPEALLQGIRDAIQANPPALSKPEMRAILLDLKKMIIESQQAERKRLLDEGRAFLAENAKQEGVVSLPSGLQYKVLEKGSGQIPKATDTVLVEYRGTRLDGQEFDSSFRGGKPVEVKVSKVIPGWSEALQLMPEGSHWLLFVPNNLAYGERGPLADQAVQFDLKLLKITSGQ